ncbi:MAG: hypothetical protein V3V93_04590, partial [bacterium]
MIADWIAILTPHLKPALVGAACGLITGLILKRLAKSLVVTVAFALAIYTIVSFTTNWLEGIDLLTVSKDAIAYAKTQQEGLKETVMGFAKANAGTS